eukprot:4547865-Ditylum_brightwellii.AAC.1
MVAVIMLDTDVEVLCKMLKGVFCIQRAISVEQYLVAMKEERACVICNDGPAAELGQLSLLPSGVSITWLEVTKLEHAVQLGIAIS